MAGEDPSVGIVSLSGISIVSSESERILTVSLELDIVCNSCVVGAWVCN